MAIKNPLDITQANVALSECLVAAVFVDDADAALVQIVRAQTLSGASDKEAILFVADRIAHLDRLLRRLAPDMARISPPAERRAG